MALASRFAARIAAFRPRLARGISSVGEFASLGSASDKDWSAAKPHEVHNFVSGQWTNAGATFETVIDPLHGGDFLKVPAQPDVKPFHTNLVTDSKSGLHNPYRNVERYLMLGRVSDATSKALRVPEIADYFTRLIMRTSPKSYEQAYAEVRISAQFLDNFSGDQPRYLARSFAVPGDHDGQRSNGHRFPFGRVAIITPFNFPLEIPALQIMGALYMGNRPTVKVDSRVSVVMEQFLRLLHACGLPKEDVDMINCTGPVMHDLLVKTQPRMTLFTGSSHVAEILARDLHGKIKIEDAGFDWKILGPDGPKDARELDYVSWVCDQDAYACSGQKCSAQSMLFAHNAWVKAGLYEKLAQYASKRRLDDLTIGPVLTWTTEAMLDHVNKLTKIPGARLLFGGEALTGHSIPKRYGAIKPTAVFVPLSAALSEQYSSLVTREVFGPVQVVTEYKDDEVDKVIKVCDGMNAHLTAAIVSRDEQFRSYVVGRTLNGTTYSGIRARTTGAPQNHWFGPAGDPRGAGIGTREAIQLVWSCHREVIDDIGPIPASWTPKTT